MPSQPPDIDFWRERYRSGRTPWDLGGVSPPVRTLVQRWFPRAGSVFIPGCGRGHEALYLAARGYQVTALDIAPEPLSYLSGEAKRRGVTVRVIEGDLFDLGPERDGVFDVILEQTCLCALHPTRHREYAALAYRILRPGGQLLGVFMEVPPGEGPPYNTPPDYVFSLFAPSQWVHEGPWPVEPRNPLRPGPEFLVRLIRK